VPLAVGVVDGLVNGTDLEESTKLEVRTCGEREGARVVGGEGKEGKGVAEGDGGESGLLIGVCNTRGGDKRLIEEEA